MCVWVVSGKVGGKVVVVELVVVIGSGLVLRVKEGLWGVCGIRGGVGVFVGKVLFMIFGWGEEGDRGGKGGVGWRLGFGEGLKVVGMLVLVVVGLGVLKGVLLGVMVRWVLVVVVEIVGGGVIKKKG